MIALDTKSGRCVVAIATLTILSVVTHRARADDPGGGGAAEGFAALFGVALPHPGARVARTPDEGKVVHGTLSWPISIPIDLWPHSNRFEPFRVVVEPGITFGRSSFFFGHFGARFVFRPSDDVIAVGAGFGTVLEPSMIAGTRVSVSPEMLVQFGKWRGTCLHIGRVYPTFTFRYDHFVGSDSVRAVTGSVGLGCW